MKVSIIEGVEGLAVYINDIRIVGSKPWGGGRTVREWQNIKREDIDRALSAEVKP